LSHKARLSGNTDTILVKNRKGREKKQEAAAAAAAELLHAGSGVV
jgi:hypothetical protein